MNLGACIGLGLLAAQTSLSRRLGLAMAVALLLAASIACASRAAMGALALGLLVLVPWLSVVRRHHRSQWSWPHFGWGLLPLAFLAPVGLFLRRTNALEGLGQRDLDKLKLIGRAAHVARDYFWTGVGRGAFEAVYGAYAPAPILVRPQWAECFPLDWALGWGVPLTALFLLSAAWGLLPNRLGVSSSPAAKGAWVAALVLGAHNLLDMGLEVPAILWNVTALLGGLVGASTLREHRRSTRRPSVATRPPPSRLGALLPATLTLCTLWPMIGAVHSWRPARDEAEALGASLPRPDAEPQTERWWAELRAALLRHPADPDLPLLAAIADAQRPTGHPLRYLNAAIVAEPASGRPYFVLGNILYDHGALDQAIGALCKGIEQQPDILSRAAKLLAARNYDAALLVRAAPRTSAAAQLLGALAQQLPDSDDRKASLLRAAFDRAPSEPRTQRMLLEIRLAQLEHRSAVCEQAARSACLEDVAALLAQAPAEDFPEARARLLLLQDHPQAAWDLLDSRCATTRDPLGCLRVRLMAAVSLGEERAQLAAEDYVNQACRFDEGCSRASAWAGAVLRDHALPRLALPYLTRAAELQGTEAAWTVVAELANALGDTGQYLAAQRHAQSVHRVTH